MRNRTLVVVSTTVVVLGLLVGLSCLWQHAENRVQETKYRNEFWTTVHDPSLIDGVPCSPEVYVSRQIALEVNYYLNTRDTWKRRGTFLPLFLSIPNIQTRRAPCPLCNRMECLYEGEKGDRLEDRLGETVELTRARFTPVDRHLNWIATWERYQTDHTMFDVLGKDVIHRGESGVMNGGFTQTFQDDLVLYHQYGLGMLLPVHELAIQPIRLGGLQVFPLTSAPLILWIVLTLAIVATTTITMRVVCPPRRCQVTRLTPPHQREIKDLIRIRHQLGRIQRNYPKPLPEIDRCERLLARLHVSAERRMMEERLLEGMPGGIDLQKANRLMTEIEGLLAL